MSRKTDSKYVLLAGASALAISFFGAAHAQEETAPDNDRRLGTVTVTTQKVEQSIQDVPIAVSAFDEDALNKLQLSGGPDLVKSIPNVSFTRGHFNGYNFKIRGIGADLVAQSGDAGVGIHQNDVPLTANRLFEAEFFDMERIEVLRGPQGTLYGRNATGGVFNAITAKPVLEEWQGNASVTLGNYNTRKYKGMVNVPIGEKVAVRLAGSYLERSGYADNAVTGRSIDGRELYGIRATVLAEPTDRIRGWLSYEYFEEDDDRLRVGKQLCKKDPLETSYAGIPISFLDQTVTSLGCQAAPLSQMDGRVNSVGTLGGGMGVLAGLLSGDAFTQPANLNLREIESAYDPQFYADQELITGKLEFDLTDSLRLTYLGSYSETSSVSVEDYNKQSPTIAFNANGVPLFGSLDTTFGAGFSAALYQGLFPGGVVNDPILGASSFFRTFDVAGGSSEQVSHELRLQSDYDGPFNFNLGVIAVDYEAIDPQANNTDGYFVISNSLTALAMLNNALGGALFCAAGTPCAAAIPAGPGREVPLDTAGTIEGLDFSGLGGQYFRSLSPYELSSVAVFGEGYYDISDNLKATVGLRYTQDEKSQQNVPTFLFVPAGVYGPGTSQNGVPINPASIPGAAADAGGDGTFNSKFEEVTGRAGLDWRPDLGFTDDTLIYGFYSRGYKGGGINPPQPADNPNAFNQFFDPEFINSYEIGTKNTLANGSLQLNATGFYYDYQGYQITQIINRTSVNFNIDSKIKGLEIESIWNPVSTLVLNTNIGLLDSEIGDVYSIDVLDRTNGRADLVALKNTSNYTNCVISAQGYATVLGAIQANPALTGITRNLCNNQIPAALGGRAGLEAALGLSGVTVTYTDASGTVRTATALEPIEGDAVNLKGNTMPGAPDTTINIGVEYTWLPGSFGDWGLTGRVDYYNQSSSFSRVYNSARDELPTWDNLNASLAFYNDTHGLRVELFGKNIANETAITGAYLTDDSSGLFTNIFLTEPRTYGIALTKSW
ncbi:TonB-dependent receptor [Hyphomonas sp. WL0036]|uniref:TonB-dependent receptor n=1 Tax=Hyphomonas sediminis TaxID=2866160 RepID=UPI001C8130E4|nr:TonB-dependent receptor [Hyphomonas sediminis]MBY9065491.1 TonB-dependent receptor [Hyphomonas sediminis]